MPIIHAGAAQPINTLQGRAVVTTDALVAGVHFFADTDPYRLGHKAVAVNLSDLAAMGATPLALRMLVDQVQENNAWLQQLLAGATTLAQSHNSQLVHSVADGQQLRLSVWALGDLSAGDALTRTGAEVGDQLMVSGTLGDAAGALHLMHTDTFDPSQPHHARLATRLEMPTPRVTAGRMLREHASAGLDLSDGLLGDVTHLLTPTAPGIRLYPERLPLSAALLAVFGRQQSEALALAGGDDYELCVTVPSQHSAQIIHTLGEQNITMTIIGKVTDNPGVKVVRGGQEHTISGGYQHFRGRPSAAPKTPLQGR